MMRKVVSVLAVALLGAILIVAVSEMPAFGGKGPAFNQACAHYLENGARETGAVNLVTGIAMDYRAYDTFGILMVLYAGMTAVAAILHSHRNRRDKNE